MQQNPNSTLNYAKQWRWLPWHLFCLVMFVAFVRLGIWQVQVSLAPAPAGASVQAWRSMAYGVTWFIFAGIALWFWWRFLQDQRRKDNESDQASQNEADASVPATQPTASPASNPGDSWTEVVDVIGWGDPTADDSKER